MRLADLDPQLKGTISDGAIIFDCPFPACNRSHRVRVAISAQPYHESNGMKYWQASGSFPDSLTLNPSIDLVELNAQGQKVRTLCWHGWIKNGDVT